MLSEADETNEGPAHFTIFHLYRKKEGSIINSKNQKI